MINKFFPNLFCSIILIIEFQLKSYSYSKSIHTQSGICIYIYIFFILTQVLRISHYSIVIARLLPTLHLFRPYYFTFSPWDFNLQLCVWLLDKQNWLNEQKQFIEGTLRKTEDFFYLLLTNKNHI